MTTTPDPATGDASASAAISAGGCCAPARTRTALPVTDEATADPGAVCCGSAAAAAEAGACCDPAAKAAAVTAGARCCG
jgi:hypothetical protein